MIFANSVPEAEQRVQESEGAGEGHALARELGRGRCWYNVRGGTVKESGKKGCLKESDVLGEKDGTRAGFDEREGGTRGFGIIASAYFSTYLFEPFA